MCKLGRLFPFEQHLCYAHTLHLVIIEVIYKGFLDNYLECDSSETDENLPSEEDLLIEPVSGELDEKNVVNENFKYILLTEEERSKIQNILKRVRTIIKIFKKSSVKNELLQSNIRNNLNKIIF